VWVQEGEGREKRVSKRKKKHKRLGELYSRDPNNNSAWPEGGFGVVHR